MTKVRVKVKGQGQGQRSNFQCTAVNMRDSALPSAAKSKKSHYQSEVFVCVSVISGYTWMRAIQKKVGRREGHTQ